MESGEIDLTDVVARRAMHVRNSKGKPLDRGCLVCLNAEVDRLLAQSDRIGGVEAVFAPFPGTDAETFIQWKGTQVCMDFHCACGHHGHIDSGFAYFVRCPQCDAVYEMGTQVLVRRITEEEAYEGSTVIAK